MCRFSGERFGQNFVGRTTSLILDTVRVHGRTLCCDHNFLFGLRSNRARPQHQQRHQKVSQGAPVFYRQFESEIQWSIFSKSYSALADLCAKSYGT